jgi:hypoxanthine phosphoribosyltransferase
MSNIEKELVFSKEQIAERVSSLATQISYDYKDKELILVGVLKGTFAFMADLVRNLSIPVKIDFVRIASYGSKASPGEIRLLQDIELPVDGKHVLVVEDIVDTGLTLKRLREKLEGRRAASVKICVLVDKSERREVPIKIDYVGFSMEKGFVVGYGMDFNEQFRELPEIYCLKL